MGIATPENDKEISTAEKKSFEYYESGKKRRYDLLFAVNGAAYTLAIWAAGANRDLAAIALGGLSGTQIAFGMAGFTLVMCFDIYCFGKSFQPDFFKPPGRLVIALLCTLIAAGWLLAGRALESLPWLPRTPWTVVGLAALGAAAMVLLAEFMAGRRQGR